MPEDNTSSESFYSCSYIQNAIAFFPSNIVKLCCFSTMPDVDICTINENTDIDEFLELLNRKRNDVIENQKKGIFLESCKICKCLQKANWKISEKLTNITFNHFMKCNLKCEHCGYVEIRDKVKDTDDNLILSIIEKLYSKGYISDKVMFDIGGGEPSLSKNIDKIIEFAISKNLIVHINSNIANYKELYVKGVNENKIALTLTPDAGSREVYKKIKGADYFEKMKENLHKYMQNASDKIEVKFILEKNNVEDIDNMIKLCLDTGVKIVVLSFDLNISENDYPNYRIFVRKFKKLCDENNLYLRLRLLPQYFLLDLEIYKYEEIWKNILNKKKQQEKS